MSKRALGPVWVGALAIVLGSASVSKGDNCEPVNPECNCDGYTTTMYAGETYPAGTAHVTNSADELIITVNSTDPWVMTRVQIYAGADPVPTNSGGNVAPGSFPYDTKYDPSVTTHTEVIPLSELGLGEGDDIVHIAVHTSTLKLDESGEVVMKHTAWAFGPDPHPGSQWGWSFCFKLLDTTPPVLIGVPDDVTVECGHVPEPPTVTATADCDGNVIDVPVEFTETSEGVCPTIITRTWTASCGITTTAQQIITVVDTTAPVPTVPPDTTIECDESSDPSDTGQATATDNCDPEPVVTYNDVITPGDCANEWTITRTWTATDECDNSASADQIIHVVDTTDPLLTLPPDVTIECDEDDQPSNTGWATATDNCDPDPAITFSDVITPGSCKNEWTITRTWTATDDCDNSTSLDQIIEVVDTTAPVLTIPPEKTIECDEDDQPSNTGWATATDNCDPAPIVTFSDVITPGRCKHEWTITRTWLATDDCGNASATQDQIINVVDTTAPELTIPADTTIECDESSDPSNTGQATATDNCDPAPVVTYNDVITPGRCAHEWTITRTWTATDDCDNSTSLDQIIEVVDTTKPVLTVPADVVIECDEDDQPSNTGQATATDNCDPAPAVTFSDSIASGRCAHEWTITRSWTATDDCGNSTSADQIIGVVDTTAPVLTPPANVSIECTESPDPAGTGQATATDNCDPAPAITFSDSDLVDGCGITRTWTATDDCDNSVSADQTITFVDNEAPVLTVPPDMTVECDQADDLSVTGQATATDDCDPEPAVTFSDSIAPGDAQYEYVITRTWTATDRCDNNSTSLDQIITVVDTTPPTVTVTHDLADDVLGPPNHALVDIGLVFTATDNCYDADSLSTTIWVFGDEDDEEPTTRGGDGADSPDAKIDPTLRLRAERKGTSDGRVYLILVSATDGSGNMGFDYRTVVVPSSNKGANLDDVLLQAAEAVDAIDEFADYVSGASATIPLGYYIIGDGPVLGPKQ